MLSTIVRLRNLALLLLAFAAITPAYSSFAREEIKPPFGLVWGEPAERLERLLRGAKAQILERRLVDGGREAWEVLGLNQPGLKRTIFYFRRNELVEVELQYQKEDWGQPQYNDYMVQVRRRIEQRYGQGQQLVRRTEAEGDVTQTLVGYKWNQNNTAIELVYFAAQNARDVFRTLSVHYKTL